MAVYQGTRKPGRGISEKQDIRKNENEEIVEPEALIS
jgi:hypothetical protein